MTVRRTTLLCLIALAGCSDAPSVPIHAEVVSLDVEPVRIDPSSWTARGALVVDIERAPGDVEPTDVLLTGFELELCAPNTLLTHNFPKPTVQVSTDVPMPLRLEAGASARATFSFDASGVPLEVYSQWDLWCQPPDQISCALPDGEASLQLTAELGDSWSLAQERLTIGPSLHETARPPLIDERPDTSEPPAMAVGTAWSTTLAGAPELLEMSVDELGRIVLFERRSDPPSVALQIFDAAGQPGLAIALEYPWGFAGAGPSALAARNGRIVLAGTFAAAATLAGQAMVPAGGDDVFVAVFDSNDGSLVWARALGDTLDQRLVDAELDADGSVAIAALDFGSTDWGGGAVTGGPAYSIARFDAQGNHVMSRRIGGTGGASHVEALELDAQGNIVVAGELNSPVDFGGGVLTPDVGQDEVWVASYDVSGAHVFSRRLSIHVRLLGIERDPQGLLQVGVRTTNALAMVTLDAAGTQLDIRTTDELVFNVHGFAVGNMGRVVLTNTTYSQIAMLTGAASGFAKHTVACAGGRNWLLASGPAGDIAIAGAFQRYASFDRGPLSGEGPYAEGVTLARMPP